MQPSNTQAQYYVSQIRDGRYRTIAGPFSTKTEAEAALPEARQKVIASDSWSDFDSFGTLSKGKTYPTK